MSVKYKSEDKWQKECHKSIVVGEDTYDCEGEEDEEGDGGEFEEASYFQPYGGDDIDDACEVHEPEREAPVDELRNLKRITQQF